MNIFDSHAHYDDIAFEEDREELLSSFLENDIKYIVNVGADIESTKRTIALCNRYSFIYGAAGIHPEAADNLKKEDFEWIREQLNNPKIVAVGEIGLDYYWKDVDPKIQKEVFDKQLQFTLETNLPVIIHSRDAAKETLDMIRATNKNHRIKGIIHCYSYTKEIAREYLEMGFLFGIGGVITFSNAQKLKEAVKYIPIESIVLETDSPYLSPIPYRGKRNSSLNLPIIGKTVAEVKGLDYEEAMTILYQNTLKIYGLEEKG